MELKIAEDCDRKLWDAIVNSSQNGSITYSWEWLRLVEKYSYIQIASIKSRSKLYPLILIENEKPAGIYPLFIFKSCLSIFCYSPPPNVNLLYLGPLMPDIDSMTQEKKQIFLQDAQVLVDGFIKKDQKSNYIQINTPPEFNDCRLFKWGGYSTEPHYTYYIDLSAGTDQIWKGFNRSLRYYIDKAKKEGITVTEGSREDAFHIYEMLKARGRVRSLKGYLGEVFDQFFPDNIKVFVAKAGSEHLTGIITIIERDKVSFWIGAPRCSYKGLSPNELVLWEAILWAGKHGYKTFEIQGADEYSLFPFKRKFNGKIVPYYEMKWRSLSLNLFSSLYRLLKKKNYPTER
jgi:hypothetical protein